MTCLPPTCSAPNFRITANLASTGPLDVIQGWNLATDDIYPCFSFAMFTDHDSTYEGGRPFYAHCTEEDTPDRDCTILTDGPWGSWGLYVDGTDEGDEEGRRRVHINCASMARPSPGMEVAEWPGIVYYSTGSFYACNTTFKDFSVVGLFYREKVDKTPENCANVELQAWCLDDATDHEGAKNSTCYLPEGQ